MSATVRGLAMLGPNTDMSHMSLDGEEVYTLWDEHSNPICLATLLIPKDDEGNYLIELIYLFIFLIQMRGLITTK